MLHERRSLVDRGACEGTQRVCNANGREVASQLTLAEPLWRPTKKGITCAVDVNGENAFQALRSPHSCLLMKKTGINSFIFVLGHFFANPIQGKI